VSNNNGFLIGSSTIISENSVVSLHNMTYTGFTFNGNCTLDSIAVQNYEKTDQQVLDTSVSTLPSWTPDMKFLASFNNTLDGSNVFGMVDSPVSWSLYRRIYQGDVLTLVATVDTGVTSWIDYKCEGNQTYEYLLFANSATQISEPIVTNKIKTTFYGYFLIGSDADSTDVDINSNVETYKFDIDATSEKVTINNSLTQLQNYTKFDSYVIGDRNFRSGSIASKIIPTIEGTYDFEGIQRWNNFLESLGAFLHDKKYKYLKLKNGQLIRVITEGSGSTFDYKLNDEISVGKDSQSLIDVTIPWNEVKEV